MVNLPTTIGTLETPYQICQDMYSKLVEIQRALQEHMQAIKPAEKVAADKKIFGSFEILSSEMDKFDDAFFSQIYRDAQRIAALARKNPGAAKDVEKMLERLEELFKLIKKAHREHMRRQHFFVSFAHKLANLTKNLTKGVKRLEKKHEAIMRKHFIHFPREVRAKILPFIKKRGLRRAA